MAQIRKPLAPALNEVTAVIRGEGVNYHESVMWSFEKSQTFNFNGATYNLPFQSAGHYEPGFFDIPLKLGIFYEQHKLLGSLFDWFGFRKKAVHMVGFVFNEGTANPIEITAPKFDWALINNDIQNNTSIEESYKEDDRKLRGSRETPLSVMVLIAVVVVAIVAVVVAITYFSGQHGTAQNLVNATVTPSPFPSVTPFPLR